MNTIMKLSSPFASKLMTVVVCGLLVVNGMFSLRNLEIRSYFVSVDILDKNPMLLEVITVTKLNDMIIESFFCDFGNKKGALPIKDSKTDNKENVPSAANCSMAMVTSAMHLILMGLSQESERKVQLDNTMNYQSIMYPGNRYTEQKVDAKEWLRNAEDAVSAIRKSLTAIDLPRAGIEANILAKLFFTRPLLS